MSEIRQKTNQRAQIRGKSTQNQIMKSVHRIGPKMCKLFLKMCTTVKRF